MTRQMTRFSYFHSFTMCLPCFASVYPFRVNESLSRLWSAACEPSY